MGKQTPPLYPPPSLFFTDRTLQLLPLVAGYTGLAEPLLSTKRFLGSHSLPLVPGYTGTGEPLPDKLRHSYPSACINKWLASSS